MVKESRWLGGASGGGMRETRPEFSGCITSRAEPTPMADVPREPLPIIGRLKCVASAKAEEMDRLDELIHYTNEGRTATLCGQVIGELRPYMGSVMWGSSGFRWCGNCERKILSVVR